MEHDPENALHLPALISLAKLAREAGVASRTLVAAARRGELPATVIGKRFFTTPEHARRYFQPHSLGGATS